MNVALFKLGPKYGISKEDCSGSTGEVIAICKILFTSGIKIDLYSNEESTPDILPFINKLITGIPTTTLINNANYDALIVINGLNTQTNNDTANFVQCCQLNVIEDSNLPVFYLLCDPLLVPNATLPHGFRKINRSLHIICQPYNLINVSELLNRHSVKYKTLKHFPFYKFPLWFDIVPAFKSTDLIYGGNARHGLRTQKIEKFYCNLVANISVEIFGRITHSDIRNTTGSVVFSGQVSHENFQHKLATSIATVSIGDEWHNGNNFNQRIFEAIRQDVVSFVDIELDPERLIYGRSDCADFLYVTDKSDINTKMLLLKDCPDDVTRILYFQRTTHLTETLESYSSNLYKIIKHAII